jgi:TRAP-type C4-dicarboxylate transport system permease small subunit
MTTMVLPGVVAALNEGVDVHVTAAVEKANPHTRTRTNRSIAILFIIAFLLSGDLGHFGAILIR